MVTTGVEAQTRSPAQRVLDAYDKLENVAVQVGAINAHRQMLEDLESNVEDIHAFRTWRTELQRLDDLAYASLLENSDFLERMEEYPGAGGLAATILDSTRDPKLRVRLINNLQLIAERGRFPMAYFNSLVARHPIDELNGEVPYITGVSTDSYDVPDEIVEIYSLFAPIAQEMGARRGRDQLIRWLLVDTMAHEVDADSRELFLEGVNPVIEEIDNSNTRYVVEVFDEYGFLRIFSDIPSLAELGIAIIHHGNNVNARREFLAIIEPLALQGEFDGQRYALFYDRLAEIEERPQRYGTQDMCVDGVRVPYTLEEPAGDIDLRRSYVGLGSIDEYFDLIRSEYGGC